MGFSAGKIDMEKPHGEAGLAGWLSRLFHLLGIHPSSLTWLSTASPCALCLVPCAKGFQVFFLKMPSSYRLPTDLSRYSGRYLVVALVLIDGGLPQAICVRTTRSSVVRHQET